MEPASPAPPTDPTCQPNPAAAPISPAQSAAPADGTRPAQSVPAADATRPAQSVPAADATRPAQSVPAADVTRPAESVPVAGDEGASADGAPVGGVQEAVTVADGAREDAAVAGDGRESAVAAGGTGVGAVLAGGVREEAAPPRLERGQERSPRDMVMSLAVLLVPIALLLIFYRVVLSGDAPVTVDPSATLAEARQAAVFTVVEPRGLGDDWHVSSATFSRQEAGATLRLGYVDPDKDPVQLVESSVPAATLLPAELGDSAAALGNFRTEAGVWRVYDGRPGEKAIVLAEPNRTILVVGRTDLKNLETLASSLG